MRLLAAVSYLSLLFPLTQSFVTETSVCLARKHVSLRMASASSSSSSSKTTDVAAKARAMGLFWRTPLIQSAPLTEKCGRPVYLKLDALQASGSFKDRGMAHLCTALLDKGVTKLVSSSGGNAGLAVTTVATQLQELQVQVVVPTTTKPMVVDKLQSMGADVTIHGENWNAADLLARQRVDEDPTASYVSPYDNTLLWTGHSTLIDELVQDLNDTPFTLVASVGGGGLLCGALEGLDRNKAFGGALVAAETEGAASFGKAWEKGEIVRLEAIDSVATSLGALEVTPVALERARQYQQAGGTFDTAICNDAEAVHACWQFAADHRLLVEPACGAALATAYSERLRKNLPNKGPLVLQVCGGSGVNVELLSQWRQDNPL